VDGDGAVSLLELAERAGPGLDGLDRKALFAELNERHDELVVAMQWFLDGRRPNEAIRLVIALAPFWIASGLLEEGSQWFACVLSEGGTDAGRGYACFEAGMLEFWRGDDERAAVLHRQALEIGGRTGEATLTAIALTGLARIALRASDIEQAQRLCREALVATNQHDSPRGRANALHVLGVTAQMAGQLEEARDFMNARMALARELQQYGGMAAEAANLAMVEHQLGNLDRADMLAREALAIALQREDEWMFPYLLSRLAAVDLERGELERSATLIGAAETMMRTQGAAWPPDEKPHYEKTIAALVEAMGTAEWEQARAGGQQLRPYEAVEIALGDPLLRSPPI
jgi:tetratricopeptide (TPR) repeat protein